MKALLPSIEIKRRAIVYKCITVGHRPNLFSADRCVECACHKVRKDLAEEFVIDQTR